MAPVSAEQCSQRGRAPLRPALKEAPVHWISLEPKDKDLPPSLGTTVTKRFRPG